MTDIDNSADILDSRDIEARIDELEAERGALVEDIENAEEAISDADEDSDLSTLESDLSAAKGALAAWDEGDEAEELRKLKAFRDELEPYCADWHHGETLIRDSYFKDYARDCAEDWHGSALREARWPFDCIDWDRAARELQMDYTSAEFDGVTYWAR